MTWAGFLTGDRARDQRNVDFLLDAVTDLFGSAGLDVLVRRAVDRAVEVTAAQRGVLLLADGAGELSVSVARQGGKDVPHDLRYSRSVVGVVWSTGQPHLTVDVEGAAGIRTQRSVRDLRLLSVLAVPLVSGARRLGVLYVDSTVAAREFTLGDRAVFEALGGLVAVAIEQARLADEMAERKRLAGEMDVARRILREQLPVGVHAPAGFDAAFAVRPCVETSGDYADLVRLEDGALALVVGDVEGHGLPAALVTTNARALLRGRMRRGEDMAAALGALNDYLCRERTGKFMTACVAVLDPVARALRWANAGHNPPWLWRGGPGVDELARTGPLLGVLPDARYAVEGPVPMGPDDALVLFTDGILEAPSPAGERYGDDRLLSSLARRAAGATSAQALLDGLLADHETHAQGQVPEDDVTCVVLRGRASGTA